MEIPHCPHCQMEVHPTFNDWTVCSRCGAILISDQGNFRKPTLYEWQEVLCDLDLLSDLKTIQNAIVIRNEIAQQLKLREAT